MNKRSEKEAPDPISKTDKLGREERSQSGARRAFRQRLAPASRFMSPKDSNEISVNRMDLAPIATMAELGRRNALPSGKSFWGWYTLTAGDVEAIGCSVKPSPSDDNPYHADILIPVPFDAEERRDAVVEYARDLAYQATFLPWGEWTSELT